MTKNSRFSFALAVILLLAGAVLRAYAIGQVPLGLSQSEIVDLRLTETVRQGSVQVFFALGDEGRETLYPAVIAGLTSILGAGTLIFSWIAFAVGMITLALTYALGRRLYGDLAGLAALGFLAVTWWPVLLSRSVGRETVLPILVTSVLLALALGLPVYGPRRPASSQTAAFAGLGVAVAIGIYLHPFGLVVGLLTLQVRRFLHGVRPAAFDRPDPPFHRIHRPACADLRRALPAERDESTASERGRAPRLRLNIRPDTGLGTRLQQRHGPRPAR
ncbi:MAG: hypothetical protein HND48_15275 [Chloroflexi bacterium]|nr:hypothetical protein [Chloroflexota bacterium]